MMPKNYLLFLLLAFLIGIWVIQGIYLPLSNEAELQEFRVKTGRGVFEISEKLEEKGLIKNSLWFNAYFLVAKKVLSLPPTPTLKAGTYSLSEAMSVADILNKMISGETISRKITIVEGWSIQDVGEELEEKGWYQAEEFYEIVGFPVSQKKNFSLSSSFRGKYDFLKSKPKGRRLEGYLFPDTYHLSKQNDSRVLVEKLLDNFESRTDNLELGGERSVFEVITMASLLEKEVKTFEDKKIVAGILWKRRKHNIPLQVDATISYITGENTVKISKRETEIDSPYNTYKYQGLPVGPICNPGLESIKAALNPTPTDYWYYLSVSEGDCPQCTKGGTYFSKSLRQHNIAKSRYLGN